MSHTKKRKKGFSLIEVILAIGLFVMVVTGLAGGLFYNIQSTYTSTIANNANHIAGETLEALRSIKDSSFSSLSNGTYGLSSAGNVWSLSGSSDTIGIYTREVTISTIDTYTKQIQVEISWTPQFTGPSSIIHNMYLTNWERVVFGNWTYSPSIMSSIDVSGTENMLWVRYDGSTYAYATRQGGNPNFIVYQVGAGVAGSIQLNSGGVMVDVALNGNYAYVSSTSDTAEIVVVNITTKNSMSVVNTVNMAGAGDVYGMKLVGNYLYAVRSADASNPEFMVYDVSTPTAPSLVGSANSPSNTAFNFVEISGNYAFVSCASDTAELVVYDISNPASPSIAATFDATGTGDGVVLKYYNNKIILGRSTGLMDIINVTNPLSPSSLSSTNVSSYVYGLALGDNNDKVFVATGDAVNELKIYNISNPASPSQIGAYNTPAGLYGMEYIESSDRLIGVAYMDTQEIVVFKPINNGIGQWPFATQQSSLNLTGAAVGGKKVKISSDGTYAYVIKGTSAETNFNVVNVSTPSSPTEVGFAKFNGVPQDLAVSGNYVYVSSTDDTQELQIINVSIPSVPSLAGSLNLGGTADPNGIFVIGTTVYMVRNFDSTYHEFYIIDASNPASPTVVSQTHLSNSTIDVYVNGNYAYVATIEDTRELRIVNITNPASPSYSGELDLTGTNNGRSITGKDNYIFLGRDTGGDVSVINVTNPASPSLLATFTVGASNIEDLSLGNSNEYLFVATTFSTAEFQLLDVTNIRFPIDWKQINATNTHLGVVYDSVHDRAIYVTSGTAAELLIYKPN